MSHLIRTASGRLSCALRAVNASLLPAVLVVVATFALADGSQSGSALAFVDVNVLPMDTERVMPRHTVVVQGDRIISMGPSDEADVPDGVQRVESQGLYLIPGLIDAHARLISDRFIGDDHLAEELALMVGNGITTARLAAGRPSLLALRERVIPDDLLSPVLYVSTPEIASIDEDDPLFVGFVAPTPFEVAAGIRRFREAGYNFVSVAAANTADVYQGIVLTARGSSTPMVGRVPAGIGLSQALQAGQHIEYLDGFLEAAAGDGADAALSGSSLWSTRDWALVDRVRAAGVEDAARLIADAQTWNVPLLHSVEASFGAVTSAAGAGDYVSADVSSAIAERVGDWSAGLPDAETRAALLTWRRRAVGQLYLAGARVVAGSGDPVWVEPYGAGLHRELENLVAAGMPPFAALAAATRRGADFFSRGGGGRTEFATVDEEGIRFVARSTSDVDFGRIDIGMRADLVLLGSNPLDDIRNVADIEGVVLRGRWLPADELESLRARAAEVLQGAALQ